MTCPWSVILFCMIRIPSGFFEYIISILIPTGDTNAYKHQLENIYIYLVIFMKLLFFQSLNHGWLSCNTIDYGLPGSVHGISQARRLEWVAISFSRGSSQTQRSNPHLSPALAGRFFSPEPPGKPFMNFAITFKKKKWNISMNLNVVDVRKTLS